MPDCLQRGSAGLPFHSGVQEYPSPHSLASTVYLQIIKISVSLLSADLLSPSLPHTIAASRGGPPGSRGPQGEDPLSCRPFSEQWSSPSVGWRVVLPAYRCQRRPPFQRLKFLLWATSLGSFSYVLLRFSFPYFVLCLTHLPSPHPCVSPVSCSQFPHPVTSASHFPKMESLQ